MVVSSSWGYWCIFLNSSLKLCALIGSDSKSMKHHVQKFLIVLFFWCSPAKYQYFCAYVYSQSMYQGKVTKLSLESPKGFSEILIRETAALYRVSKKQRHWWGKCAGALLKLRQWGLHSALLAKHLTHVSSLANNMEELLRLNSKNSNIHHFTNKLTRGIIAGKRSCSGKLKSKFSLSDPVWVWRSLQDIANYPMPIPPPCKE